MKGNRTFIFVLLALITVYIVAELNQPRKFDWVPSLRNNDKNPFGTLIPYPHLKQLFVHADIESHRIPIYNVLHPGTDRNSAYVLIEPKFNPGRSDIDALLDYVRSGNEVFLSSFYIAEPLLDTLGLKLRLFTDLVDHDSTSINFVNPALRAKDNYSFKKSMIDGYFETIGKRDASVVLGIRQDSLPNFVKIRYGNGFFLIHSAPLCFTNYFILYHNNSEYVSGALSYLSSDIKTIHWDEYYKSGREGAETPFRFFLSNSFLTWALWLTIFTLVIFVLFEMKRRQRIIPIIEPLPNTTLDFVETVSAVYYGKHDNKEIARKKVQYWQEQVRQRYFLPTGNMDAAFAELLRRKSGVPREVIDKVLDYVRRVQGDEKVTDSLLMELSKAIDDFYELSKTV